MLLYECMRLCYLSGLLSASHLPYDHPRTTNAKATLLFSTPSINKGGEERGVEGRKNQEQAKRRERETSQPHPHHQFTSTDLPTNTSTQHAVYPPYSESSSSSSSSLSACSNHSMNFSADLLTCLLTLMSTYFLLARDPHGFSTSSDTRSF